MKKQAITFVLLSLTATSSLAQVDAIMQEGDFVVDKLGTAEISIKTTLNAQQWQGWMQVYGNAQHVLKRDMKHSFAAYHVDGFSMDRNDSDREFTINMNAHGTAVYRGNNRWEMDLDKGVRARKLNEQQWLVQMTQDDGGQLLQQDFTINLPPEVESSDLAVGELGQELIRYTLPVEAAAAGGGTMLYAGGGLGVFGLILLAVGLTRREQAAVQTVGAPAQITAEEGAGVVHDSTAERQSS
ncbi:MAG: hypothetical protein AAFM91_14370 [Pseudomonadota bacterium]